MAFAEPTFDTDLDVEGFEILSRLRIRFPQTRSFLMDDSTLLRWKDSLAVNGTNRVREIPPLLTEPGLTTPGQRTAAGTRQRPAQLVFFSPRKGVAAASGQVL